MPVGVGCGGWFGEWRDRSEDARERGGPRATHVGLWEYHISSSSVVESCPCPLKKKEKKRPGHLLRPNPHQDGSGTTPRQCTSELPSCRRLWIGAPLAPIDRPQQRTHGGALAGGARRVVRSSRRGPPRIQHDVQTRPDCPNPKSFSILLPHGRPQAARARTNRVTPTSSLRASPRHQRAMGDDNDRPAWMRRGRGEESARRRGSSLRNG